MGKSNGSAGGSVTWVRTSVKGAEGSIKQRLCGEWLLQGGWCWWCFLYGMDESDDETQIVIVQIVTAPDTTTAGETSQMRGSSHLPKSLGKCQSCKRRDGVHWRHGPLTSGLPPWPTTDCKWLKDVLWKEGRQGNEAERQVRWQINGINSLNVLEKMGKEPQLTWSRLRLSTLIPISPLYNKEKMKIPWRNKRKDFIRKVCDIPVCFTRFRTHVKFYYGQKESLPGQGVYHQTCWWSSIPRTLIVEGKNWFTEDVLWPPHTHAIRCTCIHVHTHNKK